MDQNGQARSRDRAHDARPGDARSPSRSGPAPDTRVLVVDLDGTLIRSDMLYETFWAALSARWNNIFAAFAGLREGRASLKRRLSTLGSVDVTALPYNETVLQRLRDWRAAGGRTALVSASEAALVRRIADHVGLFDEAHGSDGTINLKGAAKADFLRAQFPQGFVYVGDSAADLPVWTVAQGAITVDLPGHLRARVTVADGTVEHLHTRESYRAPLLRALRPHQWLKNLLIFLPMMTAHQFDLLTVAQALLAFVVFSITASSVYLTNDLLDLDADRAHPRKRTRPFAAGTLPLKWGTVLAPGLLVAGLALAALLGPLFLGLMVLYYLLTTLYSFTLKRLLIIDICTLAVLYTMRIMAGGAATGLALSVWLLAFSIFFFFALAAVKRQAELVSSTVEGADKAHGRSYLATDLPFVSMMALAAGYVSVLVLALYLNSASVSVLYSSPAALWGICVILLYWISRVCLITHRGAMNDDPVVFATKDRTSLLCAGLILALAIAGTMA